MADGEILVLTSCTATKADLPGGGLLAAERLYTGQQHVRLMRGVRAFWIAVSIAKAATTCPIAFRPSTRRVDPDSRRISGLARASVAPDKSRSM